MLEIIQHTWLHTKYSVEESMDELNPWLWMAARETSARSS
jgi:hypothetical protein